MALNTCSFAGNLVADSTLHELGEDNGVLNFRLAVNNKKPVKKGRKTVYEDDPLFLNCAVFGKRALSLEEYMLKGVKVAVTGELRANDWEDKEGNQRHDVQLVVFNVDFMSNKDR